MTPLDESQRAMVAARLANLSNGQNARYAAGQIYPAALSLESASARLSVGRKSAVHARKVQAKGSADQRAMVAARLANLNHGGDRSKGPIGPLKLESAAQRLSVARNSAVRARKVQSKGSADQRAMVAARLANLNHGGDRSKMQICTLTSSEKIKVPIGTLTLETAAERLSVGRMTAARARKVQAKGSAELVR